MIEDQKKYDKLYDAAVTIYKFLNPEFGFYSGTKTLESGEKIRIYNNFKGSVHVLESKLNRKLNIYEQTVLAISVGFSGADCLKKVLTEKERTDIFTDLWNNEPNKDRVCLTFDRLVACI